MWTSFGNQVKELLTFPANFLLVAAMNPCGYHPNTLVIQVKEEKCVKIQSIILILAEELLIYVLLIGISGVAPS